jgi:two-component system, OmpR family, response regulator
VSNILVVDDESRIVEFVSRGLRSRGYNVDGAHSAEDARTLTDSREYDLVILDLLMPGTDGVQLLQELGVSNPRTQVLVLSAVADLRARVRVLDLGAVDYLAKPFALEELLARVRARLRGAGVRDTAEWLSYGSVTLDLDRRSVTTPSATHELPGREFLLLRHLVLAAGKVCTRKELLSAVWGYEHDPSSNVVEVYVGRLRAKLGTETIRTVRNVGYCLAS